MTNTTTDALEYTVKRRTSTVLEFHIGHDYATFTLDVQSERHYYALAIESSYGGYAYAWSAPGGSFYGFLAKLGLDYVGGKMSAGEREVFDGEKTKERLLEAIEKMVSDGECEREAADEEIELIGSMDGEYEFHEWARETVLFKDSEPWHEYYCTTGGPRAHDFSGLYRRFWPAFAIELLKLEQQEKQG